ncbi:MAG TPA: hypothetical protein VMH81_12995 [Bryobacteraceae bacterium]|nr:hypothetical protein [Bryobacteraceae bacterium]
MIRFSAFCLALAVVVVILVDVCGVPPSAITQSSVVVQVRTWFSRR